jgi:hypothetical protein
VDGALALLLVYPGGGRLLVALPFTLGMVVPVVFRRTYPVAAFAAVIAVGAPHKGDAKTRFPADAPDLAASLACRYDY